MRLIMDNQKLAKIKQKALAENIPIIMDDTLLEIEKRLKQKNPKKILEIGTACRIFSHMFFKLFRR